MVSHLPGRSSGVALEDAARDEGEAPNWECPSSELHVRSLRLGVEMVPSISVADSSAIVLVVSLDASACEDSLMSLAVLVEPPSSSVSISSARTGVFVCVRCFSSSPSLVLATASLLLLLVLTSLDRTGETVVYVFRATKPWPILFSALESWFWVHTAAAAKRFGCP